MQKNLKGLTLSLQIQQKNKASLVVETIFDALLFFVMK